MLFEVRKDCVEVVAGVVRDCMENAIALRVPLKVKLHTGDTWGSLSPLH